MTKLMTAVSSGVTVTGFSQVLGSENMGRRILFGQDVERSFFPLKLPALMPGHYLVLPGIRQAEINENSRIRPDIFLEHVSISHPSVRLTPEGVLTN